MNAARIPVTVLTGFLGSGKTTLLNRILSEHHGQRIAVIENEFGEIGVDQDLVINADEEVFEMNNGCICCTVRGDLIRILSSLMKRRDKFDRILLETTGLANPGPVAQTFFVDDDVREHFALDGIVTLADARHLPSRLEDSEEAREQIAFADVIVINKTDLVNQHELDTLERRLRAMNSVARVSRARHASVPVEEVLGIGGFDLARALEYKPTMLEPEYPFEWAGLFECPAGELSLELAPGPDPAMSIMLARVDQASSARLLELAPGVMRTFALGPVDREAGQDVFAGEVVHRLVLRRNGKSNYPVLIPNAGPYVLFTQHLPEEFGMKLGGARLVDQHQFVAAHTHDESVRSLNFTVREPLHAAKFQHWLDRLLRENGTTLFRMKGFLNFSGSADRIVIQGVHMLVDTLVLEPWGDQSRATQLVLIGKDLDEEDLHSRLRACIA
ncbi:MAG: GTP-binding protein [Gammaproteobacteria bacterium]|nr:GTP-binding protein [Gammaproteobacteria bacterium]